MNVSRLLLLLVCFSLLQSCADIAMTGAQAIYNRHSIQKNLHDQYITLQASKTIDVNRKIFRDTNISVATFHGEVLLAGQVPKVWQRAEIEKQVRAIPDIKKVYNLITIAAPSSTLKRISDTWITAKLKAKLLASNEVDGSQVKVVTENGTVYLMGILQPEEAQAAVELASHTAGVERVVKVFSYLHISNK